MSRVRESENICLSPILLKKLCSVGTFFRPKRLSSSRGDESMDEFKKTSKFDYDDFEDQFDEPFVIKADSATTSVKSEEVDDEIVRKIAPYGRYWRGKMLSLTQFWVCSLITIGILQTLLFACALLFVFTNNIFTKQIFESSVHLYFLVQILSVVQLLRQAKYYKKYTPYILFKVVTIVTITFRIFYILPVQLPFNFILGLIT